MCLSQLSRKFSLFNSHQLSCNSCSRLTGTRELRKLSSRMPTLINSHLYLTRLSKAGFPLGEFVRANRQKANVIGWWCRQCLSPANQIAFFSVRANKFTKWKTGFIATTLTQWSTSSLNFLLGEFVRANKEKKQLHWLATNSDEIISQSHSLFACSCKKIAKWKTGFTPWGNWKQSSIIMVRCLTILSTCRFSELILHNSSSISFTEIFLAGVSAEKKHQQTFSYSWRGKFWK